MSQNHYAMITDSQQLQSFAPWFLEAFQTMPSLALQSITNATPSYLITKENTFLNPLSNGRYFLNVLFTTIILIQ